MGHILEEIKGIRRSGSLQSRQRIIDVTPGRYKVGRSPSEMWHSVFLSDIKIEAVLGNGNERRTDNRETRRISDHSTENKEGIYRKEHLTEAVQGEYLPATSPSVAGNSNALRPGQLSCSWASSGAELPATRLQKRACMMQPGQWIIAHSHIIYLTIGGPRTFRGPIAWRCMTFSISGDTIGHLGTHRLLCFKCQFQTTRVERAE